MSSGTEPATRDELMIVVASRMLKDGDAVFVGIGAPSTAANLARLSHAPELVLVYESGTLQTEPDILPLSIGDPELCQTALATVSVPEMFAYWLQGGRITKGFLGGAQVDRFANINSTVIGDYHDPKVRLPGAGGAPEIASHCQETLIIASHSKRMFVKRVDFMTSIGFGSGPGDRERAGVTTKGPALVITDLCLMEPDPETCELVVTSLHAGVTRDQVTENTGWDVRFAPDTPTTPEPSTEELRILRDLRARSAAAWATPR